MVNTKSSRIKKSSHALKTGVKTLHHHVAKRPHLFLCRKVSWYDKWHKTKYHGHIHLAAALACLALAGVFVSLKANQVSALSDLSDSWNFSAPADYTASGGVALNGSGAALKEQEYSPDPDTAALFHFNEASGLVAQDSSANHNDAQLTDASFAPGIMNNSLNLNGNTSRAVVPSSPSLGLTQQNTIEAWTKFSNNFSASSSAQREGIVDNGDYQMYFDNETGKLTYELADKNMAGWTAAAGNDVAGSWNSNGIRSVNATVKMGSNIYVGVGVDTGDAEVWMWDGTSWTRIGGGPTSVNSSWDANTYEGVYSLETDGTNLYAGLGTGTGDGEVWMWNGTSWTKIGGDSKNGGWTNYIEAVYSLDYVGGKLYAGLGYSTGDAEVWSWDGSTWTKIGGDSLNSGWDAAHEQVASLTDDGTNLYAGLGQSANDAGVWKWNGTSWSQIGGDSLNGGWTTGYETVRSLKYFGGKLYAGLGDTASDAEVWVWNGTSWTKIGGDSLNSGWGAGYEQIGAFAWDGSNLYAGLGTSNGDGEVWKWNGTSWTKIGGDGDNGGWSTNQGDTVNTLLFDGGKLYAGTYDSAGDGLEYSFDGTSWDWIGGAYVNKSWGNYGLSSVNVMQKVGDYLYAGLGNYAGAAVVWRFDGTTWQLIGGQGVNNSWAPGVYEQVMSIASYDGKLEVGLGTTANDAEVWQWDGTTWTKIGGDSLNGGWTTNYEEVDSLASFGGNLYAGLGASAGDGEIWKWDGTSWTKIGGDSLNGGWTNYAERVLSTAIYNGNLYAGLGSSTGDGEIWKWDGTSWTKIGGDGLAGSWSTATYQEVESMMPYDGKLYAGLGYTTGSGSLWQWDGTVWTEVGGDDINGSWTTGTYERVKTMAVYNGDLYAGLGYSTGDGEVWRLSNGSWTKIGGASLNGGWSSSVEEIESMSAYKGKFYVGTGTTQNADDLIWSWGNNAFLQSNTSSFDTGWHHVAASYDGTTMKLFIDGNLDASATANILLPTSGRNLLIGSTYGGREYGKPVGGFDGQIDELRISDIARPARTTQPFSAASETVQPKAAVHTGGVWHWDSFADNESGGGTITFRLSDDNGATWQYWDGSAWSPSADFSQANSAADVSAHISDFPVTFGGLLWQAILKGDGTNKTSLANVVLDSTSDMIAPSSAGVSISAVKAHGGSALNSGSWTNGSSPEFSWTAGSDGESGVAGYCLYLGSDNTADPITTEGLLGTSGADAGNHCQFMVATAVANTASPGFLATALSSSNSNYYLVVKTIDKAGNISNDSKTFAFKFDNTPPENPSFISGPSGFVNNKAVTLTWQTIGGSAPNDTNSGLAGLQYRIGASGTWYGDNHTGSGDISDLLANDGSYTMQDPPDFANLHDGVNTVYFRAYDNAGNVSPSYVTAAVKLNTSGAPSEPQNIVATPSSNTTNVFNFHWDAPATFVGDVGNISYCYTVNVEPDDTNCVFTGAGITSLPNGAYATKPGNNTIYVVAKDESGNINYASYGTASFSANTSAPGMPLNTDIVDVSIRATSTWRLALTWDAPTDAGSGVAKYDIYRSLDNQNFSQIGSSSSTTYIDAGLQQKSYYYQVKACDNTNNCGALGSVVSAQPTGRYTTAASLVAGPTVSGVTTSQATVSWSTDRASDSKIALGVSSGKYGQSEMSNSTQSSAHQITLDNLAAGTTYYFKAKWTDEDGNTGVSQEYTFTTLPPPSLKEVSAFNVTLNGATIQFTSKNASKVAVYYGPSEVFSGLKTVNTSAAESTYTVDLIDLTDGTKYFYKLVSFDSEGRAYDNSAESFTTPPRPKISNLRFQPVDGQPTSTQKVTWTTNVPASSLISYGVVGGGSREVVDSNLATDHAVTISDLIDNSEYQLTAESRDGNGNLAVSDAQSFHTALDTRPPAISETTVETKIQGNGDSAGGQIIVSWHTDEPGTSQVEYSRGSGSGYNSKTAEDTQLTTEHIVVISDLETAQAYHLRPVSRDKAGNIGYGTDNSAIIGRASSGALDIIMNTIRQLFGF